MRVYAWNFGCDMLNGTSEMVYVHCSGQVEVDGGMDVLGGITTLRPTKKEEPARCPWRQLHRLPRSHAARENCGDAFLRNFCEG
jgi:hypothetical protein